MMMSDAVRQRPSNALGTLCLLLLAIWTQGVVAQPTACPFKWNGTCYDLRADAEAAMWATDWQHALLVYDDTDANGHLIYSIPPTPHLPPISWQAQFYDGWLNPGFHGPGFATFSEAYSYLVDRAAVEGTSTELVHRGDTNVGGLVQKFYSDNYTQVPIISIDLEVGPYVPLNMCYYYPDYAIQANLDHNQHFGIAPDALVPWVAKPSIKVFPENNCIQPDNTWYRIFWIPVLQVSQFAVNLCKGPYYSDGSQCVIDFTKKIEVDPTFVLGVPSNCSVKAENWDLTNPCDLSNGNKLQVEIDYSGGGEGSPTFARYYNSTGPFRTAENNGTGWRHSYSRSLDERPDKDPLKFVGIQSSSYATDQEACETGWGDIKATVWGGDLSTATATFAGGSSCEISSGGSVVAIFPVEDSGSRPIAVGATNIHTITRPSGGVHHFKLSGGNWVNELNPTLSLEVSGTDWIFTNANDAQETYNASGQLTEIRRRNGQTETLEYNLAVAQGGDDDSSTLDRVTGPFGHTISLSYDGNSRLDSVQTPDGIIQYAYDVDNNLVSTTQPSAVVRQYVYEDPNLPNHLTGIIDENSDRFATWDYDTQGRAILSEHAGSRESVAITYNANGTTTVLLGDGATRDYTFSVQQGQRRTAMITGDVCSACVGGEIADRTFDTSGFLDEAIDWNGGITQTIRNNRGLTETRIEGKGTVLARTTTTTWHTGFRLPLTITTPKNTTTFGYDSDGNVLSMTVAAGALSRAWGFTYNNDGQVLTIDGPRTDVTDLTTLTYYACSSGDECGQVATVSNALGHVTTYNSYNASGRVMSMTGPNGLQTSFTYDTRGNALTVTRTPSVGVPEVTTMTYDGVDQLLTVISPIGVTLTYAYDAAHYLASVSDNLGNKIEYDYDAMGNLIDEKTYDPSLLLTKQMQYTYDVNNQIDTIVDGTITTDLLVDMVGNLTSEVDGNNNATQNGYDVFNRLDSITDALSGVSDFDYDDHDNLTQSVAPNGATTTYVYDDLDNLTSENSPDRGTTGYTYDDAGNRLTVTDARGITATYTFDALNRVLSASFPDSAENIVYTYDGLGANETGRLTSITDQSGTTTYTYDSFGRVASDSRLISGVSYVTSYQYDGTGNIASIDYPGGRSVTYTRDALGQITQVASSKGGVSKTVVSSASYEPFGPLSALTYGNGLAVDYQYRDDYRVSDIDALNTVDKSYAYDPAGNVTGIADGIDQSNSQEYEFNAVNQLTSESWLRTAGYASGDYASGVLADSPALYWLLGEASGSTAADSTANGKDGTYFGTVSLGVPALITATLELDTAIRFNTPGAGYVVGPELVGTTVTGVEFWFQTDNVSTHRDLLSFQQNSYYRILIYHRINDGYVSVWRDVGGNVFNSDSGFSTGQPHHVALWYESAANKTYMMVDGVTQQNTFAGNLLDAVNSEVVIGGYKWGGTVNSRALGEFDDVAVYDTAVNAPVFASHYAAGVPTNDLTYDANGNRLTFDNGTAQTLAYQTLSNRLASIDSVSVSHDLAGNRTAEPGGVITYSYDDSGRLDEVSNGGVTVATYVHNALGQRVTKSISGSDTVYVYDLSGQLIAEHDISGTLIRDYVWLGGAPVAQIDAGEVFSYLQFDHLGTARLATDDSQAVVWRWDSDAFGTSTPDEDPDGNAASVTVNLRFPGQYFDVETGFHYNYFRTYDPSTGRYLESDPIGLAGGPNTYAYVGGNPLSRTDSLGLANDNSIYTGLPPGQQDALREHRRNYQNNESYDFYAEVGGCLVGACVESPIGRNSANEVLGAPELVGGGLSFCMEITPDPESCPVSDVAQPDSIFDGIDETSFGAGRRLGITVNSNKLCINIGLGIGSPISPAHSFGEQPFY